MASKPTDTTPDPIAVEDVPLRGVQSHTPEEIKRRKAGRKSASDGAKKKRSRRISHRITTDMLHGLANTIGRKPPTDKKEKPVNGMANLDSDTVQDEEFPADVASLIQSPKVVIQDDNDEYSNTNKLSQSLNISTKKRSKSDRKNLSKSTEKPKNTTRENRKIETKTLSAPLDSEVDIIVDDTEIERELIAALRKSSTPRRESTPRKDSAPGIRTDKIAELLEKLNNEDSSTLESPRKRQERRKKTKQEKALRESKRVKRSGKQSKRKLGISVDNIRNSTEDKKEDEEDVNSQVVKRVRIIRELIDTELSYVRFLSVLESTFIKPLRDVQNTPAAILTDAEINDIFRNITSICEKHRALYKQMQMRITDESYKPTSEFIDILVQFFNEQNIQELYQEYINYFDRAGEVLREKLLKSSKFKSFIDNQLQQQKDLISFPELRSFLIMPVQRLPRYIMLLQDLQRHTQNDHADSNNVLKALSAAQKITSNINSGKDMFEQSAKRDQVFNRFTKLVDRQILSKNIWPDENILLQGFMNVSTDCTVAGAASKKPKAQYVVVVSHHILVCSYEYSGKNKSENLTLKLRDLINICSSSLSFIHDAPRLSNGVSTTEEDDGTSEEPSSRSGSVTNFPLQAIRVVSLQRTETFPFFEKRAFIFTVSSNNNESGTGTGSAIRTGSHISAASQAIETWQNILQSIYQHNNNTELVARRGNQTKTHLQEIFFLPECRTELFPVATHQHCTDQELIVQEGQLMDHVFFVHKGAVNIIKTIDSKPVVITTLYENELLGEITFIHGESTNASASIVANGDCGMYVVSFSQLTEILSVKTDFSWKFYFLLCVLLSYRLTRLNWVYTASMKGGEANISTTNIRAVFKASNSMKPLTSSSSSFNDSESAKNTPTVNEPDLVIPCKYRLQKTGAFKQGVLELKFDQLAVTKKKFTKRKVVLVVPDIRIQQLTEDPLILHLSILKYDETQHKNTEHTASFQFNTFEDYSIALKALRAFIHAKRKITAQWSNNNKEDLTIPGNETLFSQGDIICNQGELTENVYQLVSGTCAVCVNNKMGEQIVIADLNQGDMFCELGFIMGIVTNAAVIVTSENALIVSCSREHLLKLGPSASVVFYSKLAKTIREKFCRLELQMTNRQSGKNK